VEELRTQTAPADGRGCGENHWQVVGENARGFVPSGNPWTTLLKVLGKMKPVSLTIRSVLSERPAAMMSGQNQASTNPMSAASTASKGATFPSSAARQASSASIRRKVAEGPDFLASTVI
jgi:hypothetical protein